MVGYCAEFVLLVESTNQGRYQEDCSLGFIWIY